VPITSLSDLTPDDLNANAGSERGTGQLEKSLRKYGAGRSILVDRNGRVIAGNKTLEGAASIGMEDCIVVQTQGDKLVVVQRTDLDLDDPKARALAVADNRISEVNLSWNPAVLQELIDGGTDLSDLWFESELAALLAGDQGEDVTSGLLPDADVDAIPEAVETRCKPADLWQLGRHRLLCGDCRSFGDMEKLLGDEKINVSVTSPPYASQRAYDEASGFKPIPPDEYKEWFYDVQANVAAFLALDGSWFVNIKEHCEEGQRHLYVKDLTIAHVREWGWFLKDELVWKHHGQPMRVWSTFKNQWEPIFHFAKQVHLKCRPINVSHESLHVPTGGGRNLSSLQGTGIDSGFEIAPGMAYPGNVIECSGTYGKHEAAFPVALPQFFIEAYSDNADIVFDPFMGSGTTLMAAEATGRCARGTEISPKYCDVIISRWEQATGKTAVRIEDDGTAHKI
jgi:DNA modification methylase